LPSQETIERIKAGLFRRTELAAAGHARLVVWNEAATVIILSEEPPGGTPCLHCQSD
jgi:hypothetical protein